MTTFVSDSWLPPAGDFAFRTGNGPSGHGQRKPHLYFQDLEWCCCYLGWTAFGANKLVAYANVMAKVINRG